uniref:Arrestin C-terminal-like domain-containing protein n=1 Tax=Ciona savignyi TaxID=51511 RepID=H2ZAK5_CIOSA
MADKGAGTRVFKKSSPNGKVTAYLGKRTLITSTTLIQSVFNLVKQRLSDIQYLFYKESMHLVNIICIYAFVDGVVLIDPEYVKERKVFVKLLCAFRYGREDLDVLGLTFRKDFCTTTIQVYPPLDEGDKKKTRLQERLMKKLGEHAYPFFIEIPKDSPCSVTLQPAPGDTGKPCGVDYELKTYVSDGDEEKIHKRNSVRLAIRKVQFAPDKKGPQPTAEVQKQFLMSDKPLCLEATLDKDLYYHGESIGVNVQVTNNSSKTVKKVKISVRQIADICLFSNAQYKCPVAVLEADDQVAPSSTLCKVYQICPLLGENKDKRGLALDGQLKHEDTNLASSTILKEGVLKENLGIIVQYKVKVKLVLGSLGGASSPPTDDIVFEDFARMRLQG